MAKIIFRRIGGRIVPIGLSTTVKPMAGAPNLKEIEVRAHAGLHKIGEVWGQQSNKRPHRFFVGSHIAEEYRGAGLGKEMYKKLGAVIKGHGGKSMIGTTMNQPVIKKVREAVGKTRGKVQAHSRDATTFVTMLEKKGKR